MTVETTSRKTTQTMEIALVNYDFDFRALRSAPGDIKCIRTITATNVDEDMTRVDEIPSPSDASDVLSYVVSISSDGIGGTVTVGWPSTSCTITIYRETTDKQESDYEDFNQFPAETVETDFDRRTMKSQEMQEDVDRALKVAITAPTGSTLPTGEADTYLGWDSSGINLENKTLPDPSTLVKATEAEAVAGANNTAYMTPLRTKQALGSYATIVVTTSATIGVVDAAAISAGNLLVKTSATIANAIITTLTVTTINISSGTIAGAVTGVTQSSADNSTKLATTAYADAAGAGAAGLPVGSVIPYAAPTAPTGWLLCYGQAVSRTVTYGTLFAAIGTAFGAGDGTTTFNVPDLRGRVPLGKDDMGGSSANRVTSASADTIGLGSGTEKHTLTETEMPSHTHTIKTESGSVGASTNVLNNNSLAVETLTNTGSAGSDVAHNNMQPYQTLNYIIKY